MPSMDLLNRFFEEVVVQGNNNFIVYDKGEERLIRNYIEAAKTNPYAGEIKEKLEQILASISEQNEGRSDMIVPLSPLDHLPKELQTVRGTILNESYVPEELRDALINPESQYEIISIDIQQKTDDIAKHISNESIAIFMRNGKPCYGFVKTEPDSLLQGSKRVLAFISKQHRFWMDLDRCNITSLYILQQKQGK